jgi:predicted RNA methylase
VKQFKRDEKQNSTKLNLDQYYTSEPIAQHCLDIARKILKKEIITQVIEPSAGNGVFSKKIKNCIAYDLEPKDESIIQQDFFALQLDYKKGRLFIGNPPYGARNTLSVRFFKKAIQLGDYVAFILPISQLNNNQQLYEFDLIYSEDLGEQEYTDRKVHCCFNIYKRPENGKLNSKPKNELSDIEIIEVRLNNKTVDNYDMAFCAWGSLGKAVDDKNRYSKEFYIKIKNNKLRNEIMEKINKADWAKLYPMTTTPNLLQWQVIDYLKKNVAEIQ